MGGTLCLYRLGCLGYLLRMRPSRMLQWVLFPTDGLGGTLRYGQPFTWFSVMKKLLMRGPRNVVRSRLSGWRVNDAPTLCLETLTGMASYRSQWRARIHLLCSTEFSIVLSSRAIHYPSPNQPPNVFAP